ncbi:hypothetical protein CBL_08401 [Carabus blaptoides fortunei]
MVYAVWRCYKRNEVMCWHGGRTRMHPNAGSALVLGVDHPARSHPYCPPGYVDSNDSDNGTWRQEIANLQSVGRLSCNNSSRNLYSVRDNLASYFVSDSGEVELTMWMVFLIRLLTVIVHSLVLNVHLQVPPVSTTICFLPLVTTMVTLIGMSLCR